jgi:hypothetical protein
MSMGTVVRHHILFFNAMHVALNVTILDGFDGIDVV